MLVRGPRLGRIGRNCPPPRGEGEGGTLLPTRKGDRWGQGQQAHRVSPAGSAYDLPSCPSSQVTLGCERHAAVGEGYESLPTRYLVAQLQSNAGDSSVCLACLEEPLPEGVGKPGFYMTG